VAGAFTLSGCQAMENLSGNRRPAKARQSDFLRIAPSSVCRGSRLTKELTGLWGVSRPLKPLSTPIPDRVKERCRKGMDGHESERLDQGN
jgi:hypothetical protein